ncbi:hypothetical protein EH223_07650 [candidate division KSB1 bacterium]|nr:hypothetical protein [candidate division KSB1 bacterium]RQW04416.1 MAG: hypothetical protein EH223_07650 [candidate division KSB1 bacterium]
MKSLFYSTLVIILTLNLFCASQLSRVIKNDPIIDPVEAEVMKEADKLFAKAVRGKIDIEELNSGLEFVKNEYLSPIRRNEFRSIIIVLNHKYVDISSTYAKSRFFSDDASVHYALWNGKAGISKAYVEYMDKIKGW